MFDLPLHPVVVHFPIVLGILLPFLALALWWAIKKEYLQEKVWILVTVAALLYGASAVVAVEVGEDDEDKVEKVVVEEVIEEHEEAGERIPWIAGALFLVSLAGLVMKNSDRVRLAFAALSLVAIIPLADAGHTGGKLVYEYGAANAHLTGETKALIQSGQFYSQNLKEEEEHDD